MIIEYCGFIKLQTFIPNTKICLISLPAARQLKLGFVKILKFKFSRDESSREEIAEKRYFKICLKVVWTTKKHVAPPFKLRDVYNIHHIFQFLQQNTKKQYLRVHCTPAKNSTASLKIARRAFARFYNSEDDLSWTRLN